MTSQEKQLIFDIAGGDASNLPMIHQIHTGFKRGTQMLQWLKFHGIIGKSFRQFSLDHGHSKLQMGSFILKRIEFTTKRQIFAGDLT